MNVADHARDLVRMHHAVIGGGRPTLRPRDLVARSWARMLDLGLDPGGASSLRDPISPDQVERRRQASPLNAVVDELTMLIGAVSDASHVLLVVTDADGIILWRSGTSSVRRRADQLGFAEGADWNEARVGTNAIGTALAEHAPVQLLAGEHFEEAQHPWYCTASPIHDPRTGELLGIIDVSGPALTLHPAVVALVETARRLAEARLWRLHEDRLERLRQTAGPLIAALTGPALLVDQHGWVAHSSGIATGPRIAAPRGDQLVSVPGLGLCRPERLTDGWLVRPSQITRALSAELVLGSPPTLEVQGPADPWRRALTTRHAEILLLLHAAGPAGLTAHALSQALFGDAEHVVTARAEVSRLKRAIGPLVDSRPYRLATDVRLTIPRTDDGEAFKARSTSPAVRRLTGNC